MRFGTWNVRTLLQAGNMNITAEEAERYKMEVAALQEIRSKVQLGNRSLLYITLEMTTYRAIEE
jgi:hypothetical protein